MSLENFPSFLLNLSGGDMRGENGHFYEFNAFRLNLTERQLLSDERPVSLTPKAFDVLAVLVERAGHLVEKEELMQLVWPDSFVEEANVARIIHTLRKVLGEDENGNKFIETVAKSGYRFVAPVARDSEDKVELRPAERVADSREIKTLEVVRIEPAFENANQMAAPRSELLRRSRPRTLLIAFILVLSVSGFWFVNRSLTANGDRFNQTQQTKNGVAYQHYQQGRVLLERGRAGDFQNALARFEKAIELDPNYAAAYAGKADAKMWIFWSSGLHDDISQARTAIDRAIELDASNAYAHTLSCRLKGTYDWDFKGAEKECGRAIELDAKEPLAHREMAFLFSAFGREGEAKREIDAAVALAPTTFNKVSRGAILYYSRRYDEAIEQLRQVEETDPQEYATRRWLMNAYEMKKDYTHALDTRIRQMERTHAKPEEIAAVNAAYAKNGWAGVLRSMSDTKRPTFDGAANFAQVGDKDRAFETLENMLDRRAVMLIHLARDPRFDPIRDDPRFNLLLKQIGLR